MINPAAFIREPLYFENICKIYPPMIKDVVANKNYAQFQKLLTITDDDIKDQFKSNEDVVYPTPLEFLLINCYHNKQFLLIAYEAFQYFTHEPVTFMMEQKMIVFGSKQEI